jgi:subtilase-type serine protease
MAGGRVNDRDSAHEPSGHQPVVHSNLVLTGRLRNSCFLKALLATTTLAAAAVPVSAQTANWTGDNSNNWFDAGNWAPAAVPTAADAVVINTVSPNTTLINANAVAGSVSVGGVFDPITQTVISGSGLLLIQPASTLTTSGGLLGDTIGAGNNSVGGVDVIGVNALWTAGRSIFVGVEQGIGILSIQAAGSVQVQGVLGVGIGLFQTGSTGILNVLSGSTLATNLGGAPDDIGAVIGSLGTGTATISGAGSSWTVGGGLQIGGVFQNLAATAPGTGTLTIANGGVVTSTGGGGGVSLGDLIGPGTGSQGTVTVTGVNSRWNAGSSLFVGLDGGNGALTIDNAGSVQVQRLFGVGIGISESGATGTLNVLSGGMLATNLGGTPDDIGAVIGALGMGTATISGAGSSWNVGGGLQVGGVFQGGGATGFPGNGTLTIAAGGVVTSTGGAGGTLFGDVIGPGAGSQGTVTVTGANSRWNAGGSLLVGFEGGNGALTIDNGGTVQVQGALGVGFGLSETGSTGTLNILSGGTLATGLVGAPDQLVGLIGSLGTGTATVSGVGSSWTVGGGLQIGGIFQGGAGNPGTGTLTIANGGVVTSTGGVGGFSLGDMIGPGTGSQGTVTVTGVNSRWNAGSNLFVGLDGGNGVLNILDRGVVAVAGNASVASSGTGTMTIGSTGRLTVGGNFTQGAAGTYVVGINTASNASGHVQVAGTATIASGATVQVAPEGNTRPVLGTRYTILTANGGVTQNTYTLSSAQLSAFIGYGLAYDPTNVYLDVLQSRSFASVGLTPNQIATGAGAESLPAGNALKFAILNLPTEDQARAAFDSLSGEVHASLQTALVEDSHFIRDAANDRIRQSFEAVGAPSMPVMSYAPTAGSRAPAANAMAYAMATKAAPLRPPASTVAIWGQGFGSWGHTDGDGNAARLNRSTGGVITGFDGVVAETWRLGVMGGYSHTNFNVRDRASSGQSDNYHVGLYGGTQWGPIGFRAGVAYTWHDIITSRLVAFPGFSDTLRADYNAGTTQVFGELGYRYDVKRLALEPFANLAYVNLRTGHFTEQGGLAALTSASSNNDTTFTTLGVRASTNFMLGTMAATARGSLGWRHAFEDVTPFSTFAFAGSNAFTVAGVPIARDAAVINAGLDFAVARAATLGIFYGGQFGNNADDQSVRGNLVVRF